MGVETRVIKSPYDGGAEGIVFFCNTVNRVVADGRLFRMSIDEAEEFLTWLQPRDIRAMKDVEIENALAQFQREPPPPVL